MDINSYKPKYSGLAGRSLVSLAGFSTEEIYEILYTARLLKMKQAAKERQTVLFGKEVLVVSKTAFSGMKVATEIAVKQLCGTPVMLPLGGTQVEALVSDRDFLPAIARYGVDGISVITDGFGDAQLINEHSTVPVIDANGSRSPLFALAALLTLWEKFGKLKDVHLSCIGSAEANDAILRAAVKCEMKVTSISPDDLAPSDEFIELAALYGTICKIDDVDEGVIGADAIYRSAKEDLGLAYNLSMGAIRGANEHCVFLHPMPVDRECEVDGQIADGENSAILDMAENLLHVTKAVFTLLLGKNIEQ